MPDALRVVLKLPSSVTIIYITYQWMINKKNPDRVLGTRHIAPSIIYCEPQETKAAVSIVHGVLGFKNGLRLRCE